MRERRGCQGRKTEVSKIPNCPALRKYWACLKRLESDDCQWKVDI